MVNNCADLVSLRNHVQLFTNAAASGAPAYTLPGRPAFCKTT